jgi:hypothetical protein
MATENSSCISDFPFDMTISIATVDCPRVYLFQNSIFSDRHVHSNFVAFRPWLLCDTAQPARLGWLKKLNISNGPSAGARLFQRAW